MTLRLVSDFRDYYDHYFDRNGNFELRRVTTDGPIRSEMFRLFDAYKINTPRHGIVRGMPSDIKWMVVYQDETLHRGDGKLLMLADEARVKYPDLFCTEYLNFPKNEPTLSYKNQYFGSSWRELFIGSRSYFLHYINCDDWRSNVGDDIRIECETDRVGKRGKKDLHYPLYAIDYVWDPTRSDFAAVDLNIAPGIGGSPIQDVLPGQQIVTELKTWIETNFKPTGV